MTKTVTLGEICEKVSNCNPALDIGDYLFTYIDIAAVDRLTKTIISVSKISGLEAPSRARQTVRSGDVLVSTVRPNLNAVAPVTDEYDSAIASTGFCVLRVKKNVADSTYVFFYSQSKVFVDEMVEKATGASYPAVSDAIIKSTKIPLPPLPEQRRIAALLDRADALRQKDRQLLAYYDKLAQSLFMDLFGDPVRNEKGWERVKIRDLVKEVKYGTSKPAEDKGAFPYLRMNNITYEGHWNFADLKYINLTKNEEPKYLLQKGDLVFNRTNSKELVGKTAVYQRDDQMAIAGYLIRSRVNDKATPEYISAYLNSKHGKTTLKGMCKNIIGMANINAQELQEIDILQPPLPLQTHFARLIEQIERQKAVVRRQMLASEGLFGRLLQESFGG